MTTSSLKKFILLVFFLILGTTLTFSQNTESYFYEHEMELSLPLKTSWSMDIGAGYRGLLQERLSGEKIFDSRHEHLELNHFTNYSVNETIIMSLGLRYRFKELFDESEVDEFRIIEQVEIDPATKPLSHRIRLEQRFREQIIHRLRYELGYTKSLSEIFSLKAATESIYAVSTNLKPEAEQRFTIGLENRSLKNIEFGLSFEYRMENYAVELAHEFFLVTGISYSL